MKKFIGFFLLLLPAFTIAQTSAKVQQNALHGTWTANIDGIEITLVLNADGTGSFDGDKIKYTTQSNKISVTIISEAETLSYSYILKGNTLTVSGGDLEEQITFTRKGSANSSAATNSVSNEKRNIAQELVGKWCFVNVNSYNSGSSSTERCITLKADGTYEYYSESSRSVNTNAYSGGTNSQNSDRGTWSYDGSRIYYTSSMGSGSGSYTLEKRNHPKNNDPMIVLDGETYVTQYQKAPWR